jgi:hypothetical protein
MNGRAYPQIAQITGIHRAPEGRSEELRNPRSMLFSCRHPVRVGMRPGGALGSQPGAQAPGSRRDMAAPHFLLPIVYFLAPRGAEGFDRGK